MVPYHFVKSLKRRFQLCRKQIRMGGVGALKRQTPSPFNRLFLNRIKNLRRNALVKSREMLADHGFKREKAHLVLNV